MTKRTQTQATTYTEVESTLKKTLLDKAETATGSIPWVNWSESLIATKQIEMKNLLQETAGVGKNGLSLDYAATHLDSFNIQVFQNGGVQISITDVKNKVIPTSFVFQGFIAKETSMVAYSKKSGESYFQVLDLPVVLLDEKENLKKIMAAAADYAGVDHIGFNKYNVSSNEFTMSRTYWSTAGRGEKGMEITAVKDGKFKGMSTIPIYDYTERAVDLKYIHSGKILNNPLNIDQEDILKRGDKVIIGASIGISNVEKYGWKIMPNWVALVERAATEENGESSGLIPVGTVSPYKKAKINNDFWFPEDD